MSWRATAYIKPLKTCPDGTPLTRSQKMLLLILSDYHNDELDYAWPSVPTLAENSLMSERHCRTLLWELEAHKMLRIVERPNDTHLYYFPSLTRGEIASPGEGAAPQVPPRGEVRVPQGGEVASSPKPSFNRQGTLRTVNNNKDNGITLSVLALAKESFKRYKWLLTYREEQLLQTFCDQLEAKVGPVKAPEYISEIIAMAWDKSNGWGYFTTIVKSSIETGKPPDRREYGQPQRRGKRVESAEERQAYFREQYEKSVEREAARDN